jgi:pilus assembly protein CpaF
MSNDVLNPKTSDISNLFGPIQSLVDDPTISEIMINGPKKIFVETKGLVKKTPHQFASETDVRHLATRLSARLGKELSEENPCCDGRVGTGIRIHCVIPPVSSEGTVITIRKQNRTFFDPQTLISKGFWDERVAFFLSACVQARLNIIVSGGTGSGKTTLLNALSNFMEPHERVVTIEDTLELQIKLDNWVRLETQNPTNIERPHLTSRDLVRHALRMRPDRIIVGESRGPEAFDMLMAMNTGHDGSLTSLHANSAREALRRLESMIVMAEVDLPFRVIRQNISEAVHLIVQVSRFPDGARRVSEIIEIGGTEGEVILSQDIFSWDQKALNIPGSFKCHGIVPSFAKTIRDRGINLPKDFFTDRYTVSTQKE